MRRSLTFEHEGSKIQRLGKMGEEKAGVEYGTEKMGGGQQESQGGGSVDIEELQKQALEILVIPPLLIHVGLVLFVLWMACQLKVNLLFVFMLGFIYLCFIESSQRGKIERRIRIEERRSKDRKLLLSEAETARWLNNMVECLWPIFLRRFAAEQILMRLAPWFLDKFKPWTAKKVMLKKLDLGSSAPVFSFFRIGRHTTDGDNLVLELKLNFSSARDMMATMSVQMRNRVGLGIWTSFHVSNIQVEGKIKVGIKFRAGWPVIQRARICFSEPPVIRMVAKPVSTYGVDVTDMPGIASWLDNMIVAALENTLVEPNLLVVDVEKLVNDLVYVTTKPQPGKSPRSPRPDCSAEADWFHVEQSSSEATLLVDILEADNLKPCDSNGKSDPYVKISLGKAAFQTSVKEKTLVPTWHEQFRIPIADWALPLKLRVRDKDRFGRDDPMGQKQIDINDIKDGERHDMWVILDNVKTGRLRIALTVDGTHSLEEKGRESLDRLASRSRSKSIRERGSLGETGSASGSLRDSPDSPRAERTGEGLGSDSYEAPLKDEQQPVDIGMGPTGCVSFVKPGRHVVRELHESECLQQRRLSRKRTSKRDQEAEKSSRQGEEVDCVAADSSSLAADPAVKKHRIRASSLWRRRQTQESKQDTSGELSSGDSSQEAHEQIVVGNSGSELRVRLEGIEGPESPVALDELPPVNEAIGFQEGHKDEPESPERRSFWRSSGVKKTEHSFGESPQESVVVGNSGPEVDTMYQQDGEAIDKGVRDEVPLPEPDEKLDKVGRSSMKKMGKGVMNFSGKAAQNFGHVFKRLHSPSRSGMDSPKSLPGSPVRNNSLKSEGGRDA